MNQIQPLCRYVYFTGYLQLLGQITKVNFGIDYETFCQKLEKIETNVFNISDHHSQTIASGSIFLDKDEGVGHIEYIVVRDDYTNSDYKERLTTFLTNFASKNGCHKIVFD